METELLAEISQLGGLGVGGVLAWLARGIAMDYRGHLADMLAEKKAMVAAVKDLTAAIRETVLSRAA